jgi:hypothetical protein
METQTRYPRRMSRQKYSPPDAATAARIRKAVRLYEQYRKIEAEYRALLSELVDPTKDDVPVAYMAELLGIERKTVYRHTGRSMS